MSLEAEIIEQINQARTNLPWVAQNYATYIQRAIGKQQEIVKIFRKIKAQAPTPEDDPRCDNLVEPAEQKLNERSVAFDLAVRCETKAALVTLLADRVGESPTLSEVSTLRELSQDPLVDEVILEIALDVVGIILFEREQADPDKQRQYSEEDEEELTTPARLEWMEVSDNVWERVFRDLHVYDLWQIRMRDMEDGRDLQ